MKLGTSKGGMDRCDASGVPCNIIEAAEEDEDEAKIVVGIVGSEGGYG